MSGEPLLKHGPNDTYSSVFHGYTISKISLLCLFVCAVIHVIIYLWRYTFDCMPYIILKGPKHYAHTFTFLNHNNAHCTQSFTLTWELFSNDLYNLYLCLQQTIPPPQAAQTQPAIMQPSNEPPPYTESSAQRVNTDDLQKRQEVNY